MINLKMATLIDGSQVPEKTLRETTQRLQTLNKENFLALIDLVEKCQNPSYQLASNPFRSSKTILERLELIDQTEGVPDTVRKVVVNSVQGGGLSLKLVNPLHLPSRL